MSAEVSIAVKRAGLGRLQLGVAAEKEAALVWMLEGWPLLETNEEDDGR